MSNLPQIVLDTNIVVSGLRSKRGLSYRLLELVGTGLFEINLSVPLVLEYEEVLYRELSNLSVNRQVVDDVIDYHCAVANHHRIFFLWRPILRDPDDEMVLELAVKAECDYIVTFNKRDFQGIERFGLQTLDPKEFLQIIGVLK